MSGGGKEGEALRGAPQQVACIMAMRAAASAAVGTMDDPIVVETLSAQISCILTSQGAVHMRSPLLRPRDSMDTATPLNEPAQLINARGSALLLQEDLTVNFARAISRAGAAGTNLKRFDIDRVFHESDAG